MVSVTGPAPNRVCNVHIGARDEAVTLRAVINAVFSTLEIDAVLAGVVDIATEATNCHACLIYLVEDDRLVLRAASPVHEAFVGRIEMGFDEGVTGWVARTKEAALIRDEALHDPRMKYFPELEEERWQSMAAVPITSRAGEVIGVIVLHTAAPREFSLQDVELLTHTATLVGGGIQDAQLYAEARERVAALTRLAEVSQRLAAATRHERIHEAATAGARAVLHADLCQLFRLEAGGHDLRLVASDPPGAPGPLPQGGALLLELLARGRHGGTNRDLWPDHEGAALLTTPLVASDEQLGLLVRARPAPVRARRRGAAARAGRPDRDGPGAGRAGRAADGPRPRQGPVRRARRRARPTARWRRPPRPAATSPARTCSSTASPPRARTAAGPTGRPSRPGWRRACAGATRPASSTPARDGLRAVVLMPDAAAAERVVEGCEAVAAAERVALGVSGPGAGVAREPPGPARGGARRPARPHAAPRGRRARLRAARRVQVPRPPAGRGIAARPPLDGGHGAARARPPAPDRAARHARGVPRPPALGRRHRAHALHPPEHAAPAARADRARHRPGAGRRGPARARAGGEARQAGRCSAARRRLTRARSAARRSRAR